MKLTVKTMTGRKFDVDVKAEEKVKDIKVSNTRGESKFKPVALSPKMSSLLKQFLEEIQEKVK